MDHDGSDEWCIDDEDIRFGNPFLLVQASCYCLRSPTATRHEYLRDYRWGNPDQHRAIWKGALEMERSWTERRPERMTVQLKGQLSDTVYEKNCVETDRVLRNKKPIITINRQTDWLFVSNEKDEKERFVWSRHKCKEKERERKTKQTTLKMKMRFAKTLPRSTVQRRC